MKNNSKHKHEDETDETQTTAGEMHVENEQVIGRAELAVVGRNRVVRDRDAADRGGHGDREEHQHEKLLSPLAAKQAPCPADERAAGSKALHGIQNT